MHPQLGEGEAAQQLLSWLRNPEPRHGYLFVGGPSGAGKSALLREAAVDMPEAVLVDAAGLSSEEVVDRVMRALGVSYGDYRSVQFLSDDLAEESPSHSVVLVTNTQWAGQTRSTAEPAHLVSLLAGVFGVDHRSTGVRFVIEVDGDVAAVDLRGQRPIALAPGTGRASQTIDSLTGRHRTALLALALAEVRALRLEEWGALCAVLGAESRGPELRALAEELSGLVTLGLESEPDPGPEGPDGRAEPEGQTAPRVRLTRESDARALRESLPATESRSFQNAVVDALLAGDEPPPSYAARALPAHAAVAGRLEELLGTPRALAKCRHSALIEALPVAFPDGVPEGTYAAELHYVDALGLAPSSHAEWLSILHLLALSRGEEGRADALIADAGPLPWRTVWTHWRAPGALHRPGPPVGPVEFVQADTSGAYVTSVDESGDELTWRASTGELVRPKGFAGPTGQEADADADADAAEDTADDSTSAEAQGLAEPSWTVEPSWNVARLEAADTEPTGTGPTGTGSSTESVPPHPFTPPRTIQAPNLEDAVGVAGLVVLGGPRGLYAVEPGVGRTEAEPLPAVGPRCKVTPRPYDQEACRPTRERLLGVFSEGTVPTLPADRLPEGLTHEPTRRFLTEAGLPAVAGFYSLDTRDLRTTGLVEQLPENGTEFTPPLADGALYELGTWLGGTLLLDGATGRVLRQSRPGAVDEDEPGDPLAGSSLASFVAMVCLQWEYMLAYATSGGLDSADLLAELTAWLSALDPAAAAGRNWGHVLEPENWHTL
ncbi:SUKH-4 family immunity protein [Streptomyces sp. Da 82-17]|uniref:SUKH-4 family immunity protein n=1 Tax=Streptomyces sp. Da 82-17 TaxID=3377116 RepID=UPI0038D40665